MHELQRKADWSVTHYDLSSYSSRAPGLAVSTALGATSVQLDGQNPSERVVYLRKDTGHLEDLVRDTSACSTCWQSEDLTLAASATIPVPESPLVIWVAQ